MNSRDRFIQIANFERKNDPMWFTFDFWYEAFLRWVKEGMPVKDKKTKKEINDLLLGKNNQYTWLYPSAIIRGTGPLGNPPYSPQLIPGFKNKVLFEDERNMVKKEVDGSTVKISKANQRGLPQYIDYPVKDRKSFNLYKRRLNPYSIERFPEGWDVMTEKTVKTFSLKEELYGKSFKERDFVLFMGCLSLLGMPRNYMGIENFSLAIYDDPLIIEDMVEWQMHYSMEMLKQVFKAGIIFDVAFIWEDIAYNKGPLFSTNFIKKTCISRYKKVTELLRNNGVGTICLDCDGNTEDLIPIWLESGINCILPLEVAADMNPLKLRKKYGKNLTLVGGIDKRELAKNKKEIDIQVKIVKDLISHGGYFVYSDHHLPPDISYENLVYFINEVNKLCLHDDVNVNRI